MWDFALSEEDGRLVTGSVEAELRLYQLHWKADPAHDQVPSICPRRERANSYHVSGQEEADEVASALKKLRTGDEELNANEQGTVRGTARPKTPAKEAVALRTWCGWNGWGWRCGRRGAASRSSASARTATFSWPWFGPFYSLSRDSPWSCGLQGTGNLCDVFRLYSADEARKRIQKKVRKRRKQKECVIPN